MTIKFIDEIDLSGKRVFLRADLNVPMNEKGEITDDTRIQAVVPTTAPSRIKQLPPTTSYQMQQQQLRP